MGTWSFGSIPPPGDSRNNPDQAPPHSGPPQNPHPAANSNDNDDGDDNPFIAFRRSVDEQAGHCYRILASGLSTLPSILHDLQARGESDPAPSESASSDSRWTHDSFSTRAEQPLAFLSQHFEPSPWHNCNDATPPSDEAISATRALLLQSRTACAKTGVHPSSIMSLYRDVDTPHPFFGSSEPAWLSVRWFRHSPYSPSQLETHPLLHRDGSKWRAAFEDLLYASTGRSVIAHNAWSGFCQDQSLYEAWAQTPRDWMLGLQCRGVLPPQLPGLYRLGSTRHMDGVFGRLMSGREVGPWGEAARRDFVELAREIGTVDADEQPQPQVQAPPQIQSQTMHPVLQRQKEEEHETELDAYEHFLGKASSGPHNHKEVSGHQMDGQPSISASRKEPQVVSTLSTTERTTLPDGTVTTKVVLRKRFADGSEQSTESVSTTLAQQERNEVVESNGAGKETKKSGWFWN